MWQWGITSVVGTWRGVGKVSAGIFTGLIWCETAYGWCSFGSATGGFVPGIGNGYYPRA